MTETWLGINVKIMSKLNSETFSSNEKSTKKGSHIDKKIQFVCLEFSWPKYDLIWMSKLNVEIVGFTTFGLFNSKIDLKRLESLWPDLDVRKMSKLSRKAETAMIVTKKFGHYDTWLEFDLIWMLKWYRNWELSQFDRI